MIGRDDVLRRMSEYGQPLILNGAVYVLTWNHLNIGGGFIAPDTTYHVMDQHRSVDVDTSVDLERAAQILKY